MLETPKSLRLHIGIFGKTNVGKSTLINALTNQYTSITSPVAGTTTDPVEKSMEMPPIGPVTIIDTAGIDDLSELGVERIERTKQILSRCDIAIIISDYRGWGKFEVELSEQLSALKIPVISVVNKIDEKYISQRNYAKICDYSKEPILTSLIDDEKAQAAVAQLKESLVKNLPEDFLSNQTIIGDLINPNDMVLLVTPIDKEAPKGRLILPQVQLIRDVLDHGAKAVVVKPEQLQSALDDLKNPPHLVVTDSQVFETVSNIVPEYVPLTSFSILFARLKGDLEAFIEGANAVNNLANGAKILIAESCSHHAMDDDIARVKIPKWLREKTGKELNFDYVSGHDFPKDLSKYSLIIHCGGCMTNKREILSRVFRATSQNVPITNYGVIIAYCKDILDKVTKIYSNKNFT